MTLLAVQSAEASRGGLPSDDNSSLITSTTVTATAGTETGETAETETSTLEEAQSAKAHSLNSISCWDALSVSDRVDCENSGILTPSCPQSQICKRVDETCGYVCKDPEKIPQPCGDDIGEFKKFFSWF